MERYEQTGILGILLGAVLSVFLLCLIMSQVEDEVFINGERFVRVDVEQDEVGFGEVVDRQCLYQRKGYEEILDTCIYFEGVRTCQAKSITEKLWRRC